MSRLVASGQFCRLYAQQLWHQLNGIHCAILDCDGHDHFSAIYADLLHSGYCGITSNMRSTSPNLAVRLQVLRYGIIVISFNAFS